VNDSIKDLSPKLGIKVNPIPVPRKDRSRKILVSLDKGLKSLMIGFIIAFPVDLLKEVQKSPHKEDSVRIQNWYHRIHVIHQERPDKTNKR
jgi:hypothetical protein